MASARATSCNAALVCARVQSDVLRLHGWSRECCSVRESDVERKLLVHVVGMSTVGTSAMGDAVCAKIKLLS